MNLEKPKRLIIWNGGSTLLHPSPCSKDQFGKCFLFVVLVKSWRKFERHTYFPVTLQIPPSKVEENAKFRKKSTLPPSTITKVSFSSLT
jgi:hypothetical protein